MSNNNGGPTFLALDTYHPIGKVEYGAKADTPPAAAVNQQLLEVLEECRFALEPYDDIKPRDWVTDRERLRRTHQSVKAILAPPAAVPEPVRPHKWDADGERCVNCGDKNWMASPSCDGSQQKVEGGAYCPFPPKPGTVAWVRMVLETAQRQGTEKDEPEGTRYIHLSATLVDLMIKSLEEQ